MGGGGGGETKHIMQGKIPNQKIIQGNAQKKEIMHKMDRIMILNQNYNCSLKVFQNAPNGI